MWMSKNIVNAKAEEKAEKGSVTLYDTDRDSIEAGSTLINRGIESYAPYGYSCVVPVGEEVMVIPSDNGQALIGTLSKSGGIKSGEIKISSKGGATIVLRNDGSIELNSLVINRNGVIENDKQ